METMRRKRPSQTQQTAQSHLLPQAVHWVLLCILFKPQEFCELAMSTSSFENFFMWIVEVLQGF
jgi:hypothetical protein